MFRELFQRNDEKTRMANFKYTQVIHKTSCTYNFFASTNSCGLDFIDCSFPEVFFKILLCSGVFRELFLRYGENLRMANF